MTKIIGRKRELQQLEEAYKAEESLFVVVYGRRRVGKTFLVREAFDDKLAFYATGVNRENKDVQLMYFYHALCKYSDAPLALPKTWLEAFDALIKILEASKEQKKVVFLDEIIMDEWSGRLFSYRLGMVLEQLGFDKNGYFASLL